MSCGFASLLSLPSLTSLYFVHALLTSGAVFLGPRTSAGVHFKVRLK